MRRDQQFAEVIPLVLMVLFNWLLHWLLKILMVVYKSDLYQFALYFAKTLHDEGHMLTCNQNHADSKCTLPAIMKRNFLLFLRRAINALNTTV